MADRKSKRMLRNLGGTFDETVEPFFDGPDSAEVRTSVVMVDRILIGLLRSEIERLRKDKEETTRFFSHFFDPTMGETERKAIVDNFVSDPPQVVMGYPKAGVELPIFAVVTTSDDETEPGLLGDYFGQTLEDEDPPGGDEAEYEGAFFEQVYTIFIYAHHPDVASYLYQVTKLIMVGARDVLESAGFIDTRFSGGELSPDEVYLPDNVFARALTVRGKSAMTTPTLLPYRDGNALSVLVMHEDMVLGGVRGRVKATTTVGGSDGEEEG